MKIAILAPPWISVPAPGYGGVESVVSALTENLVERKHQVTLFCAPGSISGANIVNFLGETHPHEIERSIYEVDHVAATFDYMDNLPAGEKFDVVHDHCGFVGIAMANRISTPIIHTLHGPFTSESSAFYSRHGHKATLVGISKSQLSSAPKGLGEIVSIPNPIDLKVWPLQETKDDYLLWIGRITPEKGPHLAIAAALEAGVPLILAGIVQPGQGDYFDREIAPYIDGQKVSFAGEVRGKVKQSLFAHAMGLLMPIRWEEPFGMVMVEALASGTPVISFPEGAARELIIEGETGFLVKDELHMAAAIAQLSTIDSRACRDWVARYCDVNVVTSAYEKVYRAAISQPRTGHHD